MPAAKPPEGSEFGYPYYLQHISCRARGQSIFWEGWGRTGRLTTGPGALPPRLFRLKSAANWV